MLIEVIIPNYNGFELIEKNLPKVINALKNHKSSKITIVDDGSKTEEQEKLSTYVDKTNKNSGVKVNLMLFQKNVGFSSNVDRAALISDSDILILLNTDVAPHEDFLDALLPHFKDELMFGVGCMDESIEDGTVLRGRGIGYWSRGFLLHKKGDVKSSSTFWVSGGSSAFRTKTFQMLGGLDPLYNPFYWEDIDISFRAQKAGYNVLFEPKSIVVHMHKKGSIKKHYKDNVIMAYAVRNQFTIVWKNITDKRLLLSHFIWLPYHLLRAVFSGNTIFLKGFLLATLRLPAIMNHRKTQIRQFKLSDREVLQKQFST